MVEVSVIIVNLNTQALLKDCLRSVSQSSVSKEIIVVDNGSTDGSVSMVKEEFPFVRILCNTSNEGFAKPNNEAMKLARGRYYFLMNSDAQLLPNSLERLVSFADDHVDVGLCGPQLLNPDGTIQPSCRGFVSLWTHFCDMFILDRLFPNSHLFAKSEMTFFDHRSTRQVDHVMAAAVLVRSEVVKSVGMFDEELSLYYNDMDWSWRIKSAGWKILFHPAAQVGHRGGSTTQILNRSFELFDEQYKNFFYYLRKHYSQAAVALAKFLIVIGFFFRLAYWSSRSLLDSSADTAYMRRFCLKSFAVGLPLWRV